MLIYACTYVEKCVVEDYFGKGVKPDTYRTIFAEPLHLTDKSLKELLQKIKSHLALSFDNLELPIDSTSDIPYFTISCTENRDGEEPSEQEMTDWRNGKIPFLYSADYTFSIEKRNVEPITVEDLKKENITYIM